MAKEISGTINDLMAPEIIGRKVAKGTNKPSGPSSPALMWRAIEAKYSAPRQDANKCCGISHPKVQATLMVANEAGALEAAAAAAACGDASFGSRSGGIAGLKPGGRHLRELASLGYKALVEALECVCPGDPAALFREILKKPVFCNEYLPKEIRDDLRSSAKVMGGRFANERFYEVKHHLKNLYQYIFATHPHAPVPSAPHLGRLLDTPFVKSFVEVYHNLRGFRAKRQHLSLFAPHFTCAT